MALVLTEPDVRALVSMDDLIEAMARALAAFSAGDVVQPLRSVLPVGQPGRFLGVMPAWVPGASALGAKLVTVFPDNLARRLPTHRATIVLIDPDSGELLAVMDGRYLTEARTAAVSAVSAKHLAAPGPATLAIVGSGVQARSHLEALARVRELAEVRVWSPTAAHRDRFVADMAARVAAPVRAVATAGAAARGAGLIALTTAATTPVLSSAEVADGAHVCAVGACRPDQREMDGALVARARVFVDSREAALHEAGDLMIPIREGRFGAGHVAAELGDVAAGRAPGRTSPFQVTIFKSLGLAVEDVAAAALVYARACERGLGRGITL
jgi:alanine dehydrogenase